jgi:uncharacterized membrane protein YdbT with pleckstrin-like domain
MFFSAHYILQDGCIIPNFPALSKENVGYLIELCGFVVLGRLGFALLQWASRTYVFTDRRVIHIRGVLTIDIFQSSLTRIQNTFLVLTLPARFFGLGVIEFTTAGTGGVEAVWRHLKNPLPIHHQLLRAMNAAANVNRGILLTVLTKISSVRKKVGL